MGRGVDHDDDNEVGSMLLLGAELLKEVEEAAATSAAAIATSTAAAAAAAAAALMDESRPAEPLLLPIGHYVVNGGPQNRTVLLEQVMSSVPAAQWQAILPPVLKVRKCEFIFIYLFFIFWLGMGFARPHKELSSQTPPSFFLFFFPSAFPSIFQQIQFRTPLINPFQWPAQEVLVRANPSRPTHYFLSFFLSLFSSRTFDLFLQ